MKLIYHPDEFLERKVQPVDIENPSFDPKELHKQMTDFMFSNQGIGLSANQIGLDAQVFVMGDKPENTNMCINPTVLEYTEETVLDLEGCLSLRKAFASICLILSLVTENCCPTSSKVWSVFIPIPKRILKTRSSLGVKEANICVVCSLRFS